MTKSNGNTNSIMAMHEPPLVFLYFASTTPGNNSNCIG
jgi:hypothetical protein